MEVVTGKNKNTKKLRLKTSFLIIILSIILLVYAIISNEPIVILVALILIIKITDLLLNLQKIRRKKTSISNLKIARTK
jgi:lipid-A-disaccharide synthase-like uncharacterized protein